MLTTALKKIDQNHTKTICWKCDGSVMVFGENHHFFIKTIRWFVKSSGFKNHNFRQTSRKPSINHHKVLIDFFQC